MRYAHHNFRNFRMALLAPHMRYEALSREPDNLRVEKDRCQREMEQLAVQNYSAFIGSAEVTQGVKQVPL